MTEISPATIASWMQLGFAVAVAWFLLTKSLPRAEERADARDKAFVAALDKQHVEHRAEVQSFFDHHERQTNRVLDAIGNLECATNANPRDKNSRG